jgi:signal transduction histidine kinase
MAQPDTLEAELLGVVSHELRTPLAVIRGAVEVLLDGNCDAATEARLKRIQRGVEELGDLLDALLVLARSDAAEAANACTPDLDAVVAKLLRDRADALREKNLQIAHEGVAGVGVAAPPRVLGVVIGNLLRAATQFAHGGVLRVEVSNAAVRIALDAPGLGRCDDADRVLGLSMIRRVCERWGWTLDEGTDRDASHEFRLRFSAAGIAP